MNPYQPPRVEQSIGNPSRTLTFRFRLHWFVAGALLGVVAGFRHPVEMMSDALSDPVGALFFFGSWGVAAIMLSLVKLPTSSRWSKASLDRVLRSSAGLVFGYTAVWLKRSDRFAYGGSFFEFVACLLFAVVVSCIAETLALLFSQRLWLEHDPSLTGIDEQSDAPQPRNEAF